MYKITHLLSVCFLTAFIKSLCSILSNSPLISNSNIQLYFQHLCLVIPTASRADLFGLYPYESWRKCGSLLGSNTNFTIICAVLSPTVGTPKILSPPLFFGIGTAFTGGGK